jgi:hypothetical protein
MEKNAAAKKKSPFTLSDLLLLSIIEVELAMQRTHVH